MTLNQIISLMLIATKLTMLLDKKLMRASFIERFFKGIISLAGLIMRECLFFDRKMNKKSLSRQ